MAIAIGAVNSTHCRPELVELRVRRRERGLLSRVGSVPVRRRNDGSCVRGVLEQVVLLRLTTFLDVTDLGADADQRVCQAVKLGLWLRLRRLKHQRSRNREGKRWRMEAVIHQTLRHILGLDVS